MQASMGTAFAIANANANPGCDKQAITFSYHFQLSLGHKTRKPFQFGCCRTLVIAVASSSKATDACRYQRDRFNESDPAREPSCTDQTV
jgi:hypothetical protein